MAKELFVPQQNFSYGLREVPFPGLGDPTQGKVRDSYRVLLPDKAVRVMITTDRASAYDAVVCTIPQKGAVLNELSAWWNEQTKDIVPNHLISVPHPNVSIVREVTDRLPIETVVRGYMAKSKTSTSLYHNYADLGERLIYGHKFPDGLHANQKLDEPILTPTTKAETGHDQMLTKASAQGIVDERFGKGVWKKAESTALNLYRRMAEVSLDNGLILADTKYEMGLIDGELILIDEAGTPDSSRFWRGTTYEERFQAGENPEGFDKEILRRFLAEHGFTNKTGEKVPVVPEAIVFQMRDAYAVPYRMLTKKESPQAENNPNNLREATMFGLQYLGYKG